MRAGGHASEDKSRSYISLEGNIAREKQSRSRQRSPQDDDDSDVDEPRINFTGVRSAAAMRSLQLEELGASSTTNSPHGESYVTNSNSSTLWLLFFKGYLVGQSNNGMAAIIKIFPFYS